MSFREGERGDDLKLRERAGGEFHRIQTRGWPESEAADVNAYRLVCARRLAKRHPGGVWGRSGVLLRDKTQSRI